MSDPRERRRPPRQQAAPDEILDQRNDAPSIVASCDAVADEWARAELDRHRKHMATICPWCLASPVDPALGNSCAACREIGGTDTWSPRDGAA